MGATLTKAQFQAAVSSIPSSSILFYTKTLGNVLKVGVGWYSIGWMTIVISDVYSETDFLNDTSGFTTHVATTL